MVKKPVRANFRMKATLLTATELTASAGSRSAR